MAAMALGPRSPRSGCRSPSSVLVLLLVVFTGVATSLRDARVEIPRAVLRYKDAELRCVYDMEGDDLYSIKWYKGQDEFFRYTPGENPPAKVFHIPSIDVMMERSDRGKVTLRRVDHSAAGRYACEVSADKPSFTTSMVEGRLNVVEVPRYPPNISGLKSRYQLGEYLRANCSTEPSHPPANLTIYINGHQYVGRERVNHYKTKPDEQRRQASEVGIRVKLLSEHFGPDNKLKIRCLATIYDVYSKVDERSVELRTSQMVPPNVLETNQPPNEPYDQDMYGSDNRRRYPGDPSAGARTSVGVEALCLVVLAALLQCAVWR